MPMRSLLAFLATALLGLATFTSSPLDAASPGNRLAYLDGPVDPYYVGRDFARLQTPQWVGEPDVEAVVTLAIDDMRETGPYEAFLRPILERLKQIDGRAAVSIMTCRVNPEDPQVAAWLREGLSIECHTADHPCPLLKDGDFSKAKSTYDRCVDQMHTIPGNRPVAFRMPCCDSLNTPSPRFWAEIFNRGTPAGNFLQLDSSVFNVVTRDDMEVPREFVVNESGEDRFRRYVPFKSFVNTIEDYPYPYVIGGRCWEFPCVVPSDWSAQHVQKPNNPDTVRDLKRALDVTVNKRGVFNLVFHPHGWIRNDQVVELIDYAVANYGRKVKFLTFREALERLNQNLLDGQPLRPDAGSAPRVWLLDVNGDRVMDVVRRDGDTLHTKVWLPELNDWRRFEQTLMVSKPSFGILGGLATILSGNDQVRLFRFVDGWQEMPFEFGQEVPLTVATWVRESVRDPQAGVGLRDFDGDGECEVYVTRGSAEETRLFHRTPDGSWIPSKLILPAGIVLLPGERDTGVRFVDVNEDGHDDLIFSNHERYALHLLEKSGPGWSNPVLSGTRPDPSASSPVIPPFIRPDGSNNGVWIHSNHLWLQNEDTSRLPDLVDRLSFETMLKRP